jgi:hypothetical protein
VFSFIGSKSTRHFLIVALVWAVLLIAALSLVRRYGTRTLPQNDEVWALYEAGPGIHLDWLWKTWAEHRIPLAKLIWKSVLELTDYDFRTGNFLTVLALAALAFAMIWTARKIRGRTIIADAFFPLAILNFGQAEVLLWWWQVNHVLAPITATLLLSILVLHGNDLQRARNRTAFRIYLASQMPHDSAQLSHVWSTTFIIQVAPTEDLSPLRSSKRS